MESGSSSIGWVPSNPVLDVAVVGATGRMGRAVIRCLADMEGMRLAGAVTEATDAALGQDAGEVCGLPSAGVPLTDDPWAGLRDARVAIDFTLPTATEANVAAAAAEGAAMVVGTTGLGAEQKAALRSGAERIPIVYARNMSMGMAVFKDLVGRAAAALDEDYDIEIQDAHHALKADAPSGTAIELGERAAAARGGSLEALAVYARHRQTGPRERGAVGFSVVRAGRIVGNHSVLFAGAEEQVELVHRAADRAVFARGAVRAAGWVVGQPPGLYSMEDVLGLK